MSKENQIEVLDISKVKDVSRISIKPNSVLLKTITLSKSGLILPEHAMAASSTRKVVVALIGKNVTSLSVGDIIVDMTYGGAEFLVHGEDKYTLCDAYNVLISVSPDNYSD